MWQPWTWQTEGWSTAGLDGGERTGLESKPFHTACAAQVKGGPPGKQNLWFSNLTSRSYITEPIESSNQQVQAIQRDVGGTRQHKISEQSFEVSLTRDFKYESFWVLRKPENSQGLGRI